MPLRTKDIASQGYPAAWGLYSAMFALMSLARGPMTINDFSVALDIRRNTAYVVMRRLQASGMFDVVGEGVPVQSGPTPMLWALAGSTPREWVRDVTNRYRRVLTERGMSDLIEAGDAYVRS